MSKNTETTKNNPEANWEIKDRTYRLSGGKSPLSYTIQTKHTRKKPLLYFDEETTLNRQIRYAENQNSIFVDEQDDHAHVSHVAFNDGSIMVPRNMQSLQKLLSIYHPKAGKTWFEFDPVKKQHDALAIIEHEMDALTTVGELEFDALEAILRAEYGTQVSTWDPKVMKRQGYAFAKNNPTLFLELAKDEDIQLKGTIAAAFDYNLLIAADGGRTVTWNNGKKVITVPFEQTPIDAMTAFVKSSDGQDVLKSIQKKLK